MSLKNRMKNRSKKQRHGATAVEMAFVLPVFLSVLFGFIEVSRLSFAANSVQVALIKSCRTLSLPNASVQDGEEAAVDYLSRLNFGRDDIDITVSPSVITPATREITMDIELTMHPFPYPIRKTLTRSRE